MRRYTPGNAAPDRVRNPRRPVHPACRRSTRPSRTDLPGRVLRQLTRAALLRTGPGLRCGERSRRARPGSRSSPSPQPDPQEREPPRPGRHAQDRVSPSCRYPVRQGWTAGPAGGERSAEPVGGAPSGRALPPWTADNPEMYRPSGPGPGRRLTLSLCMAKSAMNANWAAENLQTIRTLMERSALYRRQLAPITLLTGGVGLAAAGVGRTTQCESPRRFIQFWFAVACAALAGAFGVCAGRRCGTRNRSGRRRRAAWPRRCCPALRGLIAGFSVGASQ